MLTDTSINRTNFSLAEIYELLNWFELELTDHKISERLSCDYKKIHRFFMRVRERLKEYEEESIRVLDGKRELMRPILEVILKIGGRRKGKS